MAVQSQLSSDGNTLTIKLTDRFDFSLQNEFRGAYKDTFTASRIILDLSTIDYMDSSALGMLLLLKQHADECKGKVIIDKPSEPIRKILEIANFSKIFEIT